MLFDLRGRRRRLVQVVYLTLALLLGGGLVLFGIGGDVSGGLLNAFEGGGGQTGDRVTEDRIDRPEERLQATPRDDAVLAAPARADYPLPTPPAESGPCGLPAEPRAELQQAGRYWASYAAAAAQPSVETARYALQVYGPGGRARPKEAQRAAAIV